MVRWSKRLVLADLSDYRNCFVDGCLFWVFFGRHNFFRCAVVYGFTGALERGMELIGKKKHLLMFARTRDQASRTDRAHQLLLDAQPDRRKIRRVPNRLVTSDTQAAALPPRGARHGLT